MARRDELLISRSRTLRSRRALVASSLLRNVEEVGWEETSLLVGLVGKNGSEGADGADSGVWTENPVLEELRLLDRGTGKSDDDLGMAACPMKSTVLGVSRLRCDLCRFDGGERVEPGFCGLCGVV
jgi:hypothetical protein